MFARPTSKGGGASGAALGASLLAHLAAGVALLVGPVRAHLRSPGHEITFFAPSHARQAAASALSTRSEASGGELAFPSGPGAMAPVAPGAGHAPEASTAPVDASLKSLSGATGATKGAGDDASVVVYPFGEGMARPQLLSGRDLRYTPEALKRGVEGTAIVRCVIGSDGQVRACRVIRGLDLMDDEVVQALESRRYTPVVYDGRPIDVDYVFRVHLVLKNDAPPALSAPPKKHEGRGESRFARATPGPRRARGA